MKKLMLGLVACVALLGNSLQAQNIAGQWQGTLKAQKDLRIILVIKKDDVKLSAAMYSIDQSAMLTNVSSISLDGSTVKFVIDLIGGTYEGKLDGDGDTITGTWTQGSTLLPLVLARGTKETAWQIPAPPPPRLMAADADPSFEVATIKPVDSDAKASRYIIMQGTNRFVEKDYTLKGLIAAAYNLNPHAVSGGPNWMDSDHYDITALTPGDVRPTRDEQMAMLRNLLSDRFQLVFHREPREFSIYVLEVAKGGPKLKDSVAPNDAPFLVNIVYPQSIKLPARNVTIGDFASMLQRAVLDRPVVDKTGLTGKYDFDLEWAPDESQFNGEIPAASGDAPAAPLFTAIQRQMGLKLVPTKGPIDALIVDKAARPSAN